MNFLAQSSPWAGVDVSGELFAFSPMIALVCTMLAVVLCPIIVGRGARSVAIVAGVGLVVAFLLLLRVADVVAGGAVSGLSPGGAGGMLIADPLSAGFQIILLVFLAGVFTLWWLGSAATEENAPEFFILLIGSALGMALMASTTNLLMIVVAIEAASLPSYAIVGFDKRDRFGAEASLKYMVFGAVSLAIMLYGASLLYGLVGSLSLADVAAYTLTNLTGGDNPLLLGLALLCFFAGIAFKISAVPFHFWCPDAFEGAKIEVTTWLSVASKAAGLVLLVRAVLTFCAAAQVPADMQFLAPVAWVIAIAAAATCTVGNFAAYRQDSVKRLLAYSSIAHAGYMMMAAAVFTYAGGADFASGATALLIYVVVYMFMNLGAFGVTAVVVWQTGSDRIESFSGLMRRAPWLAVPMVICLMSLVGLPPFAGFIAKWWVLYALGSLGTTLGWFLVIVAVVNTLISLYYYLRIVVWMIYRDDGRAPVAAQGGAIGGAALVNICAAALLLLLVFASPLKTTAQHFAHGLYQTSAATSDVEKALARAEGSEP